MRAGAARVSQNALMRLGSLQFSPGSRPALLRYVRQPQPPARFAASMAEPGRGFPLPGDHTDEILAELGYNATAIAELRGSGAVS